jgi:hypothetical protein
MPRRRHRVRKLGHTDPSLGPDSVLIQGPALQVSGQRSRAPHVVSSAARCTLWDGVHPSAVPRRLPQGLPNRHHLLPTATPASGCHAGSLTGGPGTPALVPDLATYQDTPWGLPPGLPEAGSLAAACLPASRKPATMDAIGHSMDVIGHSDDCDIKLECYPPEHEFKNRED